MLPIRSYRERFCQTLGEWTLREKKRGHAMSVRKDRFYQGAEDALLKELIDKKEPYGYSGSHNAVSVFLVSQQNL